MQHMGQDSWSFPVPEGSTVPRSVAFVPRLVVNNVQAAVGSAVDGHGVTRLLSYHVAGQVERDELRVVLPEFEPAPLPISLVSPFGRLSVPKVREFVDFALPRLRTQFARSTLAS
jgi:DNA-binding transcriptional LysR family regulator